MNLKEKIQESPSLIITASIGATLSVLLFLVVENLESNSFQNEFQHRVQEHTRALQIEVDQHTNVLKSVASLFAASQDVTRTEFETFVQQKLSSHEDIQALKWVPRVLDSERSAFQSAAQHEGLDNFQITERNEQGEMVPAAQRAEYFPLYHIVPMEGNELWLGFDLSSNLSRLESLQQSRDTGKIMAACCMTFPNANEGAYDLFIHHPIYRNGTLTNTIEQRRANFQGFIIGGLHISAMVEVALKNRPPAGLDFEITDNMPLEGTRYLYFHQSRMDGDFAEEGVDTKETSPVKNQTVLDILGQEWTVTYFATPSFIAAQKRWTSLVLLAAGIVLTYTIVLLQRSALRRINQERQAKQALVKSEKRFRDITESTSDSVWEVDENAVYIYVSPKIKDLLGYEVKEVLGKKPFDLMPPEEAERIMAQFVTILELKKSFRNLINTNIHKDGHLVTLETSGTPVFSSDGAFVGYRGIDRDVTDRINAAADIIREKNTAERYLNIAGSIIIALDKQGTVSLINKRGNEVMGYKEGELIGKNWFEMCIPPEGNGKTKAAFNSIVSGNTEGVDYFETKVVTKSGDKRLIAWHNRALTDDSGAIIGTLSSGEDITEQKVLEKNLAEEHVILETVDRTLTSFLEHREARENFDSVLADMLKMTNSEYGFIDVCENEADGTPYLRTLAISNISWSEETRILYEKNAPDRFMFDDLDRLNASVITTGEMVIANEPVTSSKSKGLSKSLPTLNAFLGVPLKRGKIIVGTVGLVNRKNGYDEALVERLAPLWSALAQIIEANNIEQARLSSEQKNSHLARYDVLTGLPNRLLFHERLDWATKQARRTNNTFALLLLDLDHFKDVNDTLGHPVGDALLVAVAERLASTIRETDIVARLGGDEFAIVQTSIKAPENVAANANRICNLMMQPFDIDGHRIHTGVSIGVAMYDPEKVAPGELLAQADTALYRVKAEGRGTYRFHDRDMQVNVEQRVSMIEELHNAISEDEFTLQFQPQVNIQQRRLAGVEALIRWNHPQRGLVYPDDFIPVAEESGQLLAIDEWVLKEACQQMRAWQNKGLMAGATIAVNLSPLQFKTSDFVEKVIAVLNETGLDPKCLELEVTERTLAQNPEEVAVIMEQLNEHGVNFSIDDFGTGYSSLQYLKNLPVSKIKIAPQFVRETLSSASDASIIDAIIKLGEGFDLDIIAEGVETEEQIRYLVGKGCYLIQGYYFAKPKQPDQMEEWLSDQLPKLI